MSESKHTPGPWYAVENGGDDPDQRKIFVGKDDPYGDFVMIANCRSVWLEKEVGGTEEANARLIAAAPEMYEALKAVMQHGRIDNSEARMNMVAAAIVKAEGRS